MMYKVIRYFADLQDENRRYNEGDVFPREGLLVTEERLSELCGSDNLQGVPLIAPVQERRETPDESPMGEKPQESDEEQAGEKPAARRGKKTGKE